MFKLFKKKDSSFDFSSLKVDMHSHLIPGIDDGAKTVEDSIQFITQLHELGYEKIITTPHIMSEYYPNTPTTILNGLETVRAKLKELNLKVTIEAAAEYFIDEQFEKLLQDGGKLLTFGKNYILVEQSMFAAAPNLEAILFKLNTLGYIPILAHPERYTYYFNTFDTYKKLKSHGCLFQLNLLSLIGHYGSKQQKLGIRLLKENLIDFIGTDLHHKKHIESIAKLKDDKIILKYIKGKEFLNKELL